MNKIYQKALEKYGVEAQSKMLIEELSELIQAVCKIGRSKNSEQFTKIYNNLVEEIADVEIMLQQARLIYNINEKDIQNVKKQKLNRLKKRLDKSN